MIVVYLVTWMVDCCSVDALEGKREIEEFACRCRGLMDGGRIVVGVIFVSVAPANVDVRAVVYVDVWAG